MLDKAAHESLRLEARKLYEDSLIASDRAADWREALTEARAIIIKALRASDCLRDIPRALEQSGEHMLVFRHLMAPPTSQDQFKLICPDWPKSSEKSKSAIKAQAAGFVADKFLEWRSRRLAPWLISGRNPTRRELGALLLAVSPLIASQRVATARRNRLALEQEVAVIEKLEALGWVKVPSALIDKQGSLKSKEFMHKARFASGNVGRAEVDIAVGLEGSVVLAVECKVTNDETNSVKRINDVLKKAASWKDHWGNFVLPAALLQGVVKSSDVAQLLDKNVAVFWSHRLDMFGDWLIEHGQS